MLKEQHQVLGDTKPIIQTNEYTVSSLIYNEQIALRKASVNESHQIIIILI